MGCVFRPRLPSDDDYIRALSAGAFAEWARSGSRAVRRLIFEEHARTEVAFFDNERVGFLIVTFDRPRHRASPWVAHLSAIATDPMLRRRGIGAHMLRRAEEVAHEHSAVCLSLTTAVSNTAARALFEAGDFVALAVARNFYLPGQDAVFMHKSLS